MSEQLTVVVTNDLKSQWLSSWKVYFLFSLLPGVGSGGALFSAAIRNSGSLRAVGPPSPCPQRPALGPLSWKTGKKGAWRRHVHSTSSAQRWHLPLLLIVHWWEHATWLHLGARGLREGQWVWVSYRFTLRSLKYKGLHSWNHLPIVDNCHLVFFFAYRDIELKSCHMLFPCSFPSPRAPLSSQKLWWDTGPIWEKELVPASELTYVLPGSQLLPVSDAGLFPQVQSEAVADSMGVSRSQIPILKGDSLPLWNVTKYQDLWWEGMVGRGIRQNALTF